MKSKKKSDTNEFIKQKQTHRLKNKHSYQRGKTVEEG